MYSKLRKWRVVPISKAGVQAPAYFVVSTELSLKDARKEAMELAMNRSGLSRFTCWTFNIEKVDMK